ncbi:Hairy/enhancer-of-split with YRPW motif protein 2 [Aspergillus fumigatus]
MNAEEVRAVWTSDKGSMAQQTAETRWAKIIQGVIDDIGETAGAQDVGCQKRAESIAIQIALKDIKTGIEQNKPLTPLPDDGKLDIQEWNKQLAATGECSWTNCPWLFGECYMYRSIQRMLNSSKHWQNYDVFKRQKDSTFVKSRAAVEELASRYMQIVADTRLAQDESKEAAQKLLFIEMTEIALWGNATDLSLLANLTLEDLQNLQGREAIQKSQRNIVDNDTDDVWAYLQRTAGQTRRQIDIILDNAGFEFFTDVLYAAYLLEAGIATSIRLHTKEFPWFVSDVIPSDVASLFEHLESSECFPVRKHLDQLVPRLRKLFQSAAITTTSDPFWTTPFSFHEMPTKAPALFKELQNSYLVIFKGDLNYRKLTRDGLWPHTTTFETALGPLGKESGVKILALRTNKSDVCVGIPTQSKVDALNEEAPDGAWIRNGKYAIVSFSEGQ